MFKIIDASFTYFSSVSIFNFEQVNAGWELSTHLRMHRENALSNKTQNLTKSMNMGISLAGTQNQLFIRGSYNQNTVISGKTLFNSFQHVAFLPANIRLDEDVFRLRLQKTSSRRLDQDQYIRLGHTSSRRLQDVLPRCLQDVFKTYYQVKVFLVTQFQDIFETYSKGF